MLTKLSAKIWFKLLQSAYNNVIPGLVTASPSDQKFRHNLNVNITTLDRLQSLDAPALSKFD